MRDSGSPWVFVAFALLWENYLREQMKERFVLTQVSEVLVDSLCLCWSQVRGETAACCRRPSRRLLTVLQTREKGVNLDWGPGLAFQLTLLMIPPSRLQLLEFPVLSFWGVSTPHTSGWNTLQGGGWRDCSAVNRVFCLYGGLEFSPHTHAPQHTATSDSTHMDGQTYRHIQAHTQRHQWLHTHGWTDMQTHTGTYIETQTKRQRQTDTYCWFFCCCLLFTLLEVYQPALDKHTEAYYYL